MRKMTEHAAEDTPPVTPPPEVTIDPDELKDPGTEAPPPPRSGALIGSLAAKREALTAARSLTLDVPGYHGEVAIKFKPVDWEDIDRIGERARKTQSKSADVLAACDILIKTCEQVMYRPDDEWVRTHPDRKDELDEDGRIPLSVFVDEFNDDEPVRFETRLGEAIGFTARSARECVIELFRANIKGTGNDVVLLEYQGKVVNWVREADREVTEGF